MVLVVLRCGEVDSSLVDERQDNEPHSSSILPIRDLESHSVGLLTDKRTVGGDSFVFGEVDQIKVLVEELLLAEVLLVAVLQVVVPELQQLIAKYEVAVHKLVDA